MEHKIRVLIKQASMHRKSGKARESLKLLEQAGALSRTHHMLQGEVLFEQGISHAVLNHDDKSLERFRKALRAEPALARKAEKVAEQLSRQGKSSLGEQIKIAVETTAARTCPSAAVAEETDSAGAVPLEPESMNDVGQAQLMDIPLASTANGSEIACPFCTEPIEADAKKCKYCGEFLSQRGVGALVLSTRVLPVRSGRPRYDSGSGGLTVCYECGGSVSASARICPTCGAPLRASIYAGFWKRFLAALIDGIILWVGTFILLFIIAFGLATEDVLKTEEEVTILGSVIGIVMNWLYFALFESSSLQATLGKLTVGIVVTDLNGRQTGFGQATGRFFGKYISAFILMIGFLMAAFTERKQALHDMMAGCLVINKSKASVMNA